MKPIQSLLDRVVYPLLLAILLPTATAFGSRIATGDWLEWFSLIPSPVWIVSGVVILLWLLIVLIRKRLKHLRELDAGPVVGVLSIPRFGWMEVGRQPNYAGVLWIIRAPAPPPWRAFEPSDVSPSSLEVDIPPRCPNCETELEESRSFLIGYVWRCVACGFKRRNRDSYYREAQRVEKIARRWWENTLRDARSQQG